MTPGPDDVQYDDGECWTNCCQGYDDFEISLNSTKGDVKTALENAASATAAQDWSLYF